MEVILIDARIGYLIECAINDWEENIEEFKSYFKKETWEFIRKEFKESNGDFTYKDFNDAEFVNAINEEWDSILSDNYYDFKKLNSTKHFDSITELIQYVNDNNISVIGDLT